MSYLLTWVLRIHYPATAMMAYSMANSKHKHGECRGREQSRIGILIRLIKNGRISFPFISPTCLDEPTTCCHVTINYKLPFQDCYSGLNNHQDNMSVTFKPLSRYFFNTKKHAWPTKKLWRSRDYLAFTLRSAITECIHKSMAIDRKAA